MTTVTAVTLPVIEDPADVGVTIGYPKQGETLPYLQQQVGGYVDAIDIRHPQTGAIATLWINDEGKINGLGRNHLAEIVAMMGGWRGLDRQDWIAGPVVVTGFDPESGETTTIPDEWAFSIAHIIERLREAGQSVGGAE